jgi:hypothetical protein
MANMSLQLINESEIKSTLAEQHAKVKFLMSLEKTRTYYGNILKKIGGMVRKADRKRYPCTAKNRGRTHKKSRAKIANIICRTKSEHFYYPSTKD